LDATCGESEQIVHEGSYNYLRNTLAPQLMNEFDSIAINQKVGEVYRLEAARATDEIAESHELTTSSLTQTLQSSLVLQRRFQDAGVPLDKIAVIISKVADAVRKFQAGTLSYAALQNTIIEVSELRTPDVEALVRALADELDRTGEQFLNSQFTYHHRLSITERLFASYSGNTYENLMRIHTESQMRDAEEIPDGFELPQLSSGDNGPMEWLKVACTNRLAGLRREISVCYLGADKWSRLRYLAV
jgi:hypothetical protein